VAELKEEVERLRNIRECEGETYWWSRSLPSLRPRQQQAAPQEAEDPLPSCHHEEREDLRDSGEWKRVPARGGKQIPSRPPLPPQLPLSNRYRALECEGPANEDVGEGEAPSGAICTHLHNGTAVLCTEKNHPLWQFTKVILFLDIILPRTSWSAPHTMTAPAKKKRRVIVIGNSLLKGTEGPIRLPDPSHREVCYLSGAQVRNVARKLPGLVQPADCYPLLTMQVGGDNIAKSQGHQKGLQDTGATV